MSPPFIFHSYFPFPISNFTKVVWICLIQINDRFLSVIYVKEFIILNIITKNNYNHNKIYNEQLVCTRTNIDIYIFLIFIYSYFT